jgi:putative hydrolase of the HAD superfamily
VSDRAIRTVLFDAGGTILRVNPSVEAVYAETAAVHGVEARPEALRASFREAWRRSCDRSRERGYRTSDEILRAEWFEIVRETFGEAAPPSRIRPIFEDLYERFVSARAWSLAPGTREAVEFLRERGVRVGILSNWDSRLRRMLAELGLERSFEFVVVSHEVGFEKPHRAIFEEALRLAGTRPAETLHVGDSYEADIRPAAELGLSTLWVAPAAERRAIEGAGPGVDALPVEPVPFWETVIRGGRRQGPVVPPGSLLL